MALNPLRDHRDEVTVGDVVIAGLLFACFAGLVLNAASNLDRHRDEFAELRRERDEWRDRSMAGDEEAAEPWRQILTTDNMVVDNIALYDLRCGAGVAARCSMLVSWPAWVPGYHYQRDESLLDGPSVVLTPAPDFLP